MWNRFTQVAVAGFLGFGLLVTPGLAEEKKDKGDKTTIRQRQRNQQKRIGEGVENGQLTPKETSKLEGQEAEGSDE